MSARIMLCAVLLLGVVATAGPATAATPANTVRFGVAYLNPLSDSTFRVWNGFEFVDVKLEIDSAFGARVGYERRVNDLIGIDANLYYFKPKAKATVQGVSAESDSSRVNPVTVGVNFHLTPGSTVDFYLGPMVGYVFAADLEEKFVAGVNAGLDAPVGTSGWAIFANLGYLAYKATESGSDVEVDVNPLVASVGLGYRF